jgi:hypothetical protein
MKTGSIRSPKTVAPQCLQRFECSLVIKTTKPTIPMRDGMDGEEGIEETDVLVKNGKNRRYW